MKSTLLILSVFCSGILNGQKVSQAACQWHKSDKTEISDYKPLRKSGLLYYLSNDSENIYADIVFSIAAEQNMILRYGFILWINMDGKSMKKMGIRFPVGSHNQPGNNRYAQTGNEKTRDVFQGNLLTMANTIELIGFTNESERRFSSDNPDNFRGYVKFDDRGALIYRMVMPLTKLPVRNTKEGEGIVPFTLGLEFGFSDEKGKSTENSKQSALSSDNKGVYTGGSVKGKRPGKGSHMAKGERTSQGAIGKNSKSQQDAGGSELFWIKDIRLATSK
jgi:hypothetical protein